MQGAGLQPINRLAEALLRRGLNPMPAFVASLKDPVSAATLAELFSQAPPDVILNATSFAAGSPQGDSEGINPLNSKAANGAPVVQVVLSSEAEENWQSSHAGLGSRDIAMNVALPEVDGRILSRAIGFKGAAYFDEATQCPIATYRAREDRIEFAANLAANWARLRGKMPAERKVALILANYPNKDGRLANGVGLDTPAAAANALRTLAEAGYGIDGAPRDSEALMARLMAGPTNWLADRAERGGGAVLPLDAYSMAYGKLPKEIRDRVEARWGMPESDPFFSPETHRSGGFHLSIHEFGNAAVGLQPARGYNIDPAETYHSPDLVPPHNYFAFYIWLRDNWAADAIIHMGKHGNLEWLPGKSVALSEACLPEAALGPMPHIYPFIVNDPGEGTQAKRRAGAVILDHLTPPLTRAETYGPLKDLEALVDEYFEAAGVDPRRIAHLRREILSLTSATGIDTDAGLTGEDEETDLAKLDAYLCELKEAQIRDGLHVFGASPAGEQARDLAIALARAPRGDGTGANASLLRAMASDLGLGFDPLDCDMAAPAAGMPAALGDLSPDPWRTQGDTVERLEMLAIRLVGDGGPQTSAPGPGTEAVLGDIAGRLAPSIAECGPAEEQALLAALDGILSSPVRPALPHAAGRMSCLLAATSIPSTAAPCRHGQLGS